MQKNIADGIADSLSTSLNEVYNKKTENLMALVKRQANEIDRRGEIIMRLEEAQKLQQDNIEKLAEQNRHLESLVAALQDERQKLLEEAEDLKKMQKRAKKRETDK